MAINTPEMTTTETVSADVETAVTIPADAASLAAPDGPATATPDADPGLDADGRVAAVWAALNAEPGGSATAIGAAADLSRMVAGKILNQFEADGRARREPGVSDGGRGRAADRWFPIAPEPATNTDTDADADADAEPTGTADTSAPDLMTPDALPSALTTPDTDRPDTDTPDDTPDAGAVPAAPDEEDLIADSADQGSGGADDDPAPVPETAASELGSEPVTDDPAWARVRAELAALADLFSGVIMAKSEGNAVMALGCLEMAMTKVATAHRNARAVLTGTAAPARSVSAARPGAATDAGDTVRPGALRDLVYAHLVEFPDKDFTPYEIGKVINRSSGAVANALDRLVSLGEAVLSCERPRRFALAPTANPNPHDMDGAGADTDGD